MTTPKKPIDFTRLESCPKCEKSWQGKSIPRESRELYGGAEWFSRVIGISSRQQDRTIAWQCPDCHACWDRDTSRPRKSFNLTGGVACLDLQLERLMPFFQHIKPERISLNGRRHYIMAECPGVPDGTVLPSVTTVLSSMAPVGKIMALVNWRKRVGPDEANRRTRLAANRGTWLHGVLEDWFGEEDIEHHLDSAPGWRPYFDAATPFLETIQTPLLVESAVGWFDGEKAIGFSGTLDMVAQMSNGTIALVDWKTSYKEKPDYQLADYKKQLGAYSMAFEAMYGQPIDEAWCVISCYDPENKEVEPSLQLVHLDGAALVCEQAVFQDTVQRFFKKHYPGQRAFTITADRG